MSIKEFFGFGGYVREPEGYMSAQHLLFVSCFVLVMILCAVYLGLKGRNRDEKFRNRVLVVSAIAINAFELLKIVLLSFRGHNPLHFLNDLPLFLCSIQLVAIPLAAFTNGRIKEASLDLVTIFGLLGAVLGTYCAGQNYSAYPVLSFDNTVSAITHCIAGFASLYILISGMVSMQKRNIPITTAILFGFCVCAYVANIFLDCNYMFLQRGDGTPYDILYNLTGGSAVLYPLCVVLLFVIYISGYYYIYYAVKKRQKERKK